MPDRKGCQHQICALFASCIASRRDATSEQQITPPSLTSSPAPSVPNGDNSTVTAPQNTAPQNTALEKALEAHLQDITDTQKEAFTAAFKKLDDQTLLVDVQKYDAAHKNDSSFRPQTERLSKSLDLLSRFMKAIAPVTHANQVVAIAIGSFCIVIDLALKCTTFFSRLAEMVSSFDDYLGPLAEYASADNELVQTAVTNVYVDILKFGWKARCVFTSENGEHRKYTSIRAFCRQQWEPFETEFLSIKEDMKHHLDVLQHSVRALNFNSTKRAEYDRQRSEDRKAREGFLSWLSSIHSEETHQAIYAKRQDNTGDWFMNTIQYRNWLKATTSSLLWCHGKPGIGKSVLASNVLEHVTADFGLRENTATCFVYYDYRDTQLANITRVIAELIKQLCRRKSIIPQNLLQIKEDALSPSLVGTKEWFISLLEDLNQVYLVFDALDECPEENRGDILCFISSILTASVACQVKIFATSRRETDIAEAFEGKQLPTIQIQAKNVAADIESFVRIQVESLLKGEPGKKLYVASDDLKDMIIHDLTEKADGMFLWVKLQLDSLCLISKTRNDSAVQKALKTLPHGLPNTYIQIIRRIEDRPDDLKNMALYSLAWIVYAREPLNTERLLRALALRMPAKEKSDLQLPPIVAILDSCCNLLEVVNGVIRPVHFTVQEFLTDSSQGYTSSIFLKLLRNASEMHGMISIACLKYISLLDFKKNAQKMFYWSNHLFDDGFACYACKNFDHHLINTEQIPPRIIRLLEKVLQQKNEILRLFLQFILTTEPYEFHDEFLYPMYFPISPGMIIYGTSLYKIPSLRLKWTAEGPPMYALLLASSRGLSSAVQEHLDLGSNIDEYHKSAGTPLYQACSRGYLKIVKILLERGADVNVREDDDGHAFGALEVASPNGYEDTVILLLKNGANVNSLVHKRSALGSASLKGHREIVILLLNHDADVNAGNAVLKASYAGKEDIVALLLERQANPACFGKIEGTSHSTTPLNAALWNSHPKIGKLLLENGVYSASHGLDAQFGTIINMLAFYGHVELLHYAVENHGSFALSERHGRTAIHLAARSGCIDTFRYVLQMGFDPTVLDAKGDGVLGYASSSGSLEVLKAAFDLGLHLEAECKNWSPLHWACRAGEIEVIRFLLRKNVQWENIIVPATKRAWSPFAIAIVHGNEPCVDDLFPMLGERGASQRRSIFGPRGQCYGCSNRIHGTRFCCRTCGDLVYCFMCKPFLESLHVNHVWESEKDMEREKEFSEP